MPRYVCSLCGAGAISKCIYQRTTFPDNGMEAILSHLLKRSVKQVAPRHVAVTFIVHQYLSDEDSPSDSESILNAFKMMQSIDEQTAHEYSCDHKYMVKGECNFGCCKEGV